MPAVNQRDPTLKDSVDGLADTHSEILHKFDVVSKTLSDSYKISRQDVLYSDWQQLCKVSGANCYPPIFANPVTQKFKQIYQKLQINAVDLASCFTCMLIFGHLFIADVRTLRCTDIYENKARLTTDAISQHDKDVIISAAHGVCI